MKNGNLWVAYMVFITIVALVSCMYSLTHAKTIYVIMSFVVLAYSGYVTYEVYTHNKKYKEGEGE